MGDVGKCGGKWERSVDEHDDVCMCVCVCVCDNQASASEGSGPGGGSPRRLLQRCHCVKAAGVLKGLDRLDPLPSLRIGDGAELACGTGSQGQPMGGTAGVGAVAARARSAQGGLKMKYRSVCVCVCVCV